MRGLGRDDDGHFKTRHEGEWRDGIAVVIDRISGQVMYEAPPPEEVPARMEGMFEWLERKLSAEAEPPFVLAGVIHYGITDVHPFADGNGRAARLMQTALLMKADVLPGRMFSFEGYYARDRDAYCGALRSVRLNTFNQESWLEYFLRGLAEGHERVATTVADLGSLLSVTGSKPLRLTASQERGLVALHIAGRREFTRREYEEAAGVGRTAAGDDLRSLPQHGVLTPRGRTSARRYAFPGRVPTTPAAKRRGRPAKWDETRIERELHEYLAGRSTWPSWDEFLASGRADLYSAASRNGGIARWRRIVGM